MDIARIDLMVRDFPAGNTPTISNIFPKLLTVTAIVATAALLFFMNGSGLPEFPRLAAGFPVVNEITTPETSNPEAAEPTTPTVKATPEAPANIRMEPVKETVAAPLVTVPTNPDPFKTSAAPAAAPSEEKVVAEPIVTPNAFGETTITGTWELQGGSNEGELILYHKERVNGRKITWSLFANLTGEERRLLFGRAGTTGYVEREAGRIIVMKEDNAYAFQPRNTMRNNYEAKGWGTSYVPAEDVQLLGMSQGVSFSKAYTDKPAELTWLRYFTNGVGREYLEILREAGVPEAGLSSLWRLPNQEMSAKDLRRAVNLLQGMDDNGGPLSINALVGIHTSRGLVEAMNRLGYNITTTDDWQQLKEAKVKPWYLGGVNDGRTVPFTIAEVLVLNKKGIKGYFAAKHTKVFARDLPLADILLLSKADVSGYDVERLMELGFTDLSVMEYIDLKKNPEKTMMASSVTSIIKGFPVRRKGWKRYTEKLPVIRKLIVDEDIHVVIVPGTENNAEVSERRFRKVRVTLDMNDDGTLRIRKKVPFGWEVNGMTLAEIRLTVTDLEKIVVKKGALVETVLDRATLDVTGVLRQVKAGLE